MTYLCLWAVYIVTYVENVFSQFKNNYTRYCLSPPPLHCSFGGFFFFTRSSSLLHLMLLIKTSSPLYHRSSKGWKTQWIRLPPPVYWLLIQFMIYWEQLKENSEKNLMELIKELRNSSFLHLLQSTRLKYPFHFWTTLNLHSLVWDFKKELQYCQW